MVKHWTCNPEVVSLNQTIFNNLKKKNLTNLIFNSMARIRKEGKSSKDVESLLNEASQMRMASPGNAYISP